MAKSLLSLPIVSFLLLLLISISEGAASPANAQTTWCVAKPSSSDAELQNNLNYACEHARGCNIFNEGGACYQPNTLINHASVAMNLYYAAAGRNYWNCNFSSSGLATITDPSYGSCKYA